MTAVGKGTSTTGPADGPSIEQHLRRLANGSVEAWRGRRQRPSRLQQPGHAGRGRSRLSSRWWPRRYATPTMAEPSPQTRTSLTPWSTCAWSPGHEARGVAIIFHRLKTGHYKPGYERARNFRNQCPYSSSTKASAQSAARRRVGRVQKANPNNLDDEQVVKASYEKYAQQRREAKQAAAKETEVKRVQTDERGRWQHIPTRTRKTTKPLGGDGQES